MPESSSDPNDGSDMPQKRSLPSWMSSKESANKSGEKKKQADSSGGSKKQAKGNGDSSSHQTTRSISDFSKLLVMIEGTQVD